MTIMNRWTTRIASIAAVGALGLFAALAHPQPPQGFGFGAPPRDENLPENPVATAIPTISAEVSGPGTMYPSLMPLPAGRDTAHFGYETKEYFVSGMAAGKPYRTRIVVRKPADDSAFSGYVLAEGMHPSGNAWMFHLTHRYTMDSGHAGVEILTNASALPAEHNPARYADLSIDRDQGSEIIAQVGALIKSESSDSPLAGVSRLVLAGTSASAGMLIRYLPTHRVYRMQDFSPIYDGFLPTANGSNIQQVDVPLIHMPTQSEVMRANVTGRQDGNAPGDQYRLYEFAGIAHMDTRYEPYLVDPCAKPISRFPNGAYTSLSLHHLLAWIEDDALPPRGDRILVDRNETNDGSLMALDEYGNAIGGVRTPYVDIPAKTYGVRNVPAEPPNPEAHPFTRIGDVQRRTAQLCGLSGYEEQLSAETLRGLYGNKRNYVTRVEERLDELIDEGWFLPLYKDEVMEDAANIDF